MCAWLDAEEGGGVGGGEGGGKKWEYMFEGEVGVVSGEKRLVEFLDGRVETISIENIRLIPSSSPSFCLIPETPSTSPRPPLPTLPPSPTLPSADPSKEDEIPQGDKYCNYCRKMLPPSSYFREGLNGLFSLFSFSSY